MYSESDIHSELWIQTNILYINLSQKVIWFTHCFHFFRCSQRQKVKEETKNGQHRITCTSTIRQEEAIPPLAQEEEVQNYDENIEDLEKGTDEDPSHTEDTVTVHMKNETIE